jgi:MerR HTH family regulatory protein
MLARVMRVSEVARALLISPTFLRRLERSGRIPPARRDLNGHRRYTDEDLDRLRRLILGPSGDDVRQWVWRYGLDGPGAR